MASPSGEAASKPLFFSLETTCGPFAQSEFAAGLDMTPQKLTEVQKHGREPTSLHTLLGEDGDSEFGGLIEDSEAIQPGEAASFTLLQEQLHPVLGTLSEREAGVVSMRFGLTNGQPRTLDEIGKVYGVTRSGSASSSPRPWPSCAARPGPRPCGTTSADLTGRQPRIQPAIRARPARARAERPDPDGQRRDRHRAGARAGPPAAPGRPGVHPRPVPARPPAVPAALPRAIAAGPGNRTPGGILTAARVGADTRM